LRRAWGSKYAAFDNAEPDNVSQPISNLGTAVALPLASETAVFGAPNIVVILTDDQEDTGSMAYMPKVY
jgi:hypothetical protein